MLDSNTGIEDPGTKLLYGDEIRVRIGFCRLSDETSFSSSCSFLCLGFPFLPPSFTLQLPHHHSIQPECKCAPMMEMLRLFLLLLGIFSLQVTAQINTTTLTLDEVNSQILSFLQGVQNGTLSARDSTSRGLPSGCTLAVSSP